MPACCHSAVRVDGSAGAGAGVAWSAPKSSGRGWLGSCRALEAARRMVLQSIVNPELERIASKGTSLPVSDYKSALQEKLQAIGRPQPTYVLVKERGPEHSKIFTVEARLQALPNNGKAEFVGRADGSTKKNAEQDAARQVLEYLGAAAGIEPSRESR